MGMWKVKEGQTKCLRWGWRWREEVDGNPEITCRGCAQSLCSVHPIATQLTVTRTGTPSSLPPAYPLSSPFFVFSFFVPPSGAAFFSFLFPALSSLRRLPFLISFLSGAFLPPPPPFFLFFFRRFPPSGACPFFSLFFPFFLRVLLLFVCLFE
jgi:hypothetical protein